MECVCGMACTWNELNELIIRLFISMLKGSSTVDIMSEKM